MDALGSNEIIRKEYPLFIDNKINAVVRKKRATAKKRIKEKGGVGMVKLSEIVPKSKLSEEFKGEKTSIKDLKDKTIKIVRVSDELDGDFGKFRLVQLKDGKETKVLIVNQNTTAYKKISAIYQYLKENPGEEVEAKVVAKKSKNKRTYYDLE
jgi:hypothetical protein